MDFMHLPTKYKFTFYYLTRDLTFLSNYPRQSTQVYFHVFYLLNTLYLVLSNEKTPSSLS